MDNSMTIVFVVPKNTSNLLLLAFSSIVVAESVRACAIQTNKAQIHK